MKTNSNCPVCEAELNLEENTVENELIECIECGSELVIKSVEPLKIEEAPQIEEDWGQ
ncbi:MAG: lysine biosynthesis protein LysW [Candidatus Aminicenantaceae bacterium]